MSQNSSRKCLNHSKEGSSLGEIKGEAERGFRHATGVGGKRCPIYERQPKRLIRQDSNAARTSSICSSGFTFGQIFLMRPSGPIKNVTRCVPRYFRPMKLFSPQTPY